MPTCGPLWPLAPVWTGEMVRELAAQLQLVIYQMGGVGGSHLLSGPWFSICNTLQTIPPHLHTSAYLGLGIIEDVGRFLAEAG